MFLFYSLPYLFQLFLLYYIPLENLTFADEETAKIEGFPNIGDCKLYMNWKDHIDVSPNPFLISTKDFGNNFSAIWKNWLQFYNGIKYIPTLFYEIICNRSTHINCFLNLSQAIDRPGEKFYHSNEPPSNSLGKEEEVHAGYF